MKVSSYTAFRSELAVESTARNYLRVENGLNRWQVLFELSCFHALQPIDRTPSHFRGRTFFSELDARPSPEISDAISNTDPNGLKVRLCIDYQVTCAFGRICR